MKNMNLYESIKRNVSNAIDKSLNEMDDATLIRAARAAKDRGDYYRRDLFNNYRHDQQRYYREHVLPQEKKLNDFERNYDKYMPQVAQ